MTDSGTTASRALTTSTETVEAGVWHAVSVGESTCRLFVTASLGDPQQVGVLDGPGSGRVEVELPDDLAVSDQWLQ